MELGGLTQAAEDVLSIEGSNFILDVDTAIMSIGTSPNPIRSTTLVLKQTITMPYR